MSDGKTKENRTSDSFFNYLNIDQSRPGVVIVGVQVPFFQLMWFLVKLIIAAVPAILIASFIIFFITGFLSSLVGGFFDGYTMSGNITRSIQ